MRRFGLPRIDLRIRGRRSRLEAPPEPRRDRQAPPAASAIAEFNRGYAKPRGHKRRRALAMRARRANVDRLLRARGRK